MFSYEFYKVVHLISVFLVLGTFCIGLYSAQSPKWSKIVSGIFSFLILVAGMGLLARIGVNHGEGFPTWVILKMVIWLAVAALVPITVKRMKDKSGVAFGIIMFLISIAAIVAIIKPFD